MSGILQNGLRLIDDILQLVFQTHCAACRRDKMELQDGLCRFCRIWFPLRGPLCQRCGTPLSLEMAACGECARRKRPSLQAARSLFWLEEATKGIIHRIKYAGRFEYLSLFQPSINAGFVSFFPEQPMAIPVPLHPSRLLQRGFNQAEILARYVAKAASLPWDVDGLRKSRATLTQAGLSASQRQENLRGSFHWKGKLVPKSVLLIDDVYTTGATLQACARTLRRAGVRKVYAWTLFRTPIAQ